MQWLKGHSLDDFLRQPAPLKPSQAIRVGRQVALGLAAAHEHGLIHRDIKPANIWVENVRGGHIKLLDFGLARPLVDDVHLTQTGAIMGTPAYMAPEQAHGDKVDHRCDLFSLGVVLYRMATGQLPFSGPTPAAILVALAIKNPPTPESLGANLPPSLSELIMQLLEKDPAKRPGSAQEVADRLLRIGQEMTAAATGSADLAKSALNLSQVALHWLQFKNTQISDLSPLSGASLYGLDIGGTCVSDLSPIRGAPLKELWVGGTDVDDLRPLQGMPLDTLGIDGSSVSDLSPLEGLSLRHIRFSPNRIDHGIGALQQMKSLQNIGIGGPEMPPNEFWKKYDAGEFK